jgi:hypothetical protein
MEKTNQENKSKAILEIREFLIQNNLVKDEQEFYLSDWYITRFLIARKFDLKKTKTMIKGYFVFKERMEKIAKKHKKINGTWYFPLFYDFQFIYL